MIKKTSLLTVSASLALLLGAPAIFAGAGITSNGGKESTANTKSTTRIISDSEFAKMAAEGGLAEIKLGQLAEEKGTSQAVQDFGKQMVADHSKAEEELKTTASNDKINLPSEINARDEAVYNRLLKLSGTAFDPAYAREMVRDHSADIAMFRREANDGKHASIKNFANQTLPTLQDHLKEARKMLNTVSAEDRNQIKRPQS